MANTKSAKKAVRSAVAKKLSNDTVKNNYRTAKKELEKAIASGAKKAELGKLLTATYQAVDKAAKKSVKVLSQNKAARIKSALAKKLAA
jgi:small subunit ribosomal protein S20